MTRRFPHFHSVLLLCALACLPLLIPFEARCDERMVGMGPDNDSLPLSRFTSLQVPILDIVTVDSVWPTCDYVAAPTGAWGQSITNATKVPGRMRMVLGDSVLYDTGEWIDDVSGMTIKIRGNSTAYYDKKPYKIKLQEKADLLMRDSIDGRDKNWLLIRDEAFKAMMGFEVNRALGLPWTPGYRYVNVIINGQYEGIYMLVESVRRNTDCRVDVSKSGFIFECDPYWWNEPFFIPSNQREELRYTFKYPEPEDLTDADISYMTGLIHQLESCYTGSSYASIIDVRSFAAWCLGHDILMTHDFAGSNRFFAKADRSDTTRVTMPLLWDFDSTESDTLGWSKPHIKYFASLFQNPDRTFVDRYVALWQEISPTLYTRINTIFDALRRSPEGSGISSSLKHNNTRWGSKWLTTGNFVYRPRWIQKRLPSLTREINLLNPPGDIDINGAVDLSDLNLLINMLLERDHPNMRVADINHDNQLDISDVNLLICMLLDVAEPTQPTDPEEN